MLSSLAAVPLWWIIPPLLTRLVVAAVYRLAPRVRPQSPQAARRHHSAAQWLVTTLYCAYSLLSTCRAIHRTPSFYSALQISPATPPHIDAGLWEEHVLKPAWKKIVIRYHPDKIGTDGADQFIHFRNAYEILSQESRRTAYNRFGPDVIASCPKCLTHRDYLTAGLQSVAGFYALVAVGMWALTLIRKDRTAFWRSTTLLLCLSIELLWVLKPPAAQATALLSGLVTYQAINLLRQCWISTSFAIAHLTPADMRDPLKDVQAVNGALQHLASVSTILLDESTESLKVNQAGVGADRAHALTETLAKIRVKASCMGRSASGGGSVWLDGVQQKGVKAEPIN